MGGINFGRAILGGLVAGVILNVGEFVLNGVILANDMKEFFKRCGFPPEPPSSFMVIAIVITLILGIVIVIGYAAIRSRFGAGPKTAIIAALFAWFGVYVYQNVIAVGLGIIPTRLFMIALAWGLVEYIIATIAGAALYKEA
jgi:hypothetical protein